VVRDYGERLWTSATRLAHDSAIAPDAGLDDRMLYWARLKMGRSIARWQPRWSGPDALTIADRESLLDTFEDASRGLGPEALHQAGGQAVAHAAGGIHVLVSGFDPFDLHLDATNRNVSGAVALALDGWRIPDSGGAELGQVRGVIFPVRYSFFNAARIEGFLRPIIGGPHPPDLILTLSLDPEARVIEIEQRAARGRELNYPDNLLNVGGDRNAPTAPTDEPRIGAPQGMPRGPQFLGPHLPQIRTDDIRAASVPITTHSGSDPREGSGGNYLSNEIFYRTRLLEANRVWGGHVHLPPLDPRSVLVSVQLLIRVLASEILRARRRREHSGATYRS
jgi:pyrrolidone-carboxylate peptidase